MANEIFKELKTRIALKQNTYQYWVNGEGKDYIPLYGEVCFCEIPAGSSQATNAPTVLFKVGTAKKDAEGNWVEGTNKTFSQLNWVSALAADVYSWAKKTEADFIAWVNTVVQHPAPTVDTNTVYRVVKVSELNYKLQSKSAFDADTAWVDVQGSTITIPEGAKYDLSAKTENSEAILSLAGTDNTEDKVAIVGDDAVSITVDGGKIKVSAHDTKYTGSNGDEIKVTATNDGAIAAELTETVRTELGQVNTNKEAISGLVQRVTAVEKDINDNRNAWLKDDNDNTTYQFSIPTSGSDKGKLLVEKKEIGEVAWTKVGAYDFTTPDELTQILSNYYTKDEIDGIVNGINTGVMSVEAGNDAIEIGGTAKNPTVGVKLNPTQGNVTLSLDGGLKAQVNLSHNHDSQYKKIQTAVANPTANGESLTFIDSITQNTQGVITATKKTVGKVANATHADSADNATHANAADNATHANAADTATHADAATKVDAKLTVKVGKTTIEYDGSEAKTADIDTAINAAINAIPDAPVYSLKKATDSGAYAAVYNLMKDGEIVGDTINIPKDMVVKEGKVVTNPAGQTPGTYIELKLQNVTNPLYINVSSLIEYVTSGSATSDAIVIAVSKDHKVTATITDGKITLAKLERGVRDAIALAETALQEHQDISGKADKVTGATAGNFAGLNANGNLVDSGKKAADFVLDADLHQWAKEAQIYHTTTESVTSGAGEVEYSWVYASSDFYHDLLIELNDNLYIYSESSNSIFDASITSAPGEWWYRETAGTMKWRHEVETNYKIVPVDPSKYVIFTREQAQNRIAQGGDLVVIPKQDVTAKTISAPKTYTGNAFTSVEWDATINNGAGGLKFTKGTQFATKAELDAALEAFGGDLSAITDNNTKYTFEIPASGEHAGKLVITEINYVNGVAEGSGTAVYCDFVTPEELNTILASYVKDVTAGTGLKVTTNTHSSGKGLTKQIDIDPDVVFVLDCNW